MCWCFQANIGRVANLTLCQAGGEGKWYGVDIRQGRLDLEGCDISSQSLSCVAIHDGADLRLRRNKIHDSKQGGVHVYGSGLGTLEDNDITGNARSGAGINTGGNPTLRGNQIHDNEQGGVTVYDSGLGTLEYNDITGNGLLGYYSAPSSASSSASSSAATATASPKALRIFPPAETTRAVPTTGATAIMTAWMSSAMTPLSAAAPALAR